MFAIWQVLGLSPIGHLRSEVARRLLRTPFAPGRLPTAGHPTPDAVGGGAKGTGKASVPSFVVSTFSRSVCAVSTSGVLVARIFHKCTNRDGVRSSTYERMTQFVCCRLQMTAFETPSAGGDARQETTRNDRQKKCPGRGTPQQRATKARLH